MLLQSIIGCILMMKICDAAVSVKQEDARNCSDPDNIYLPPTATNTTLRLIQLRAAMEKYGLSAYIVPASDAHLSEYVASRDRKRQWITGFTGSAGTAVITINKAAVWTDGRYLVQAERQLDCNWIQMQIGAPNVPTLEEWILSEISEGTTVGAHPFLFSVGDWQNYKNAFVRKSIKFDEVIPDLMDEIWVDRPTLPSESLIILPIEYSGKSWKRKLEEIREELKKAEADYLLLTRLDEIAWFFNLRGDDIPYTPVFTAYAIIPVNGHIAIYANQSLFNDEEIKNYLNSSDCFEEMTCVIVNPYEDANSHLEGLASNEEVLVWLPFDSTTYGTFIAVNEKQQITLSSPIRIAKSVKNPKEIAAMKQAHIYDAVALCEYLQWLENHVNEGKVSEIIGEEMLKNFRLAQPTNQGLSFGSISASGPNGAIIHYGATPETNRNLSIDEMYMIDSGGQYLGGTTDVTRTVHYGKPSDFQKNAFTRALMGMIDTEKAIFPYNKKGRDLDILARRYLYESGLEYLHGTGHGIGQFLCIHEYPPGFSTSSETNFNLQTGMFTSIEPGYYETGYFGLRHENINVVVEALTEHNFNDYQFYTFEPVTLVPFQTKLIQLSLMSEDQISYLNNYHMKVRKIIGTEAEKQGKLELKDWVYLATEPLSGSCTKQQSLTASVLLLLTFLFFILK